MYQDQRILELKVARVYEVVPSLKLTAKAPENGWLEYDRFLLGWPNFRGELLVLGRVVSNKFFFKPRTKWGEVSHFDDYFSNRLVQPPIFMFVASRWETRLENNTSYTFMKKLVVGLKVDATTSN